MRHLSNGNKIRTFAKKKKIHTERYIPTDEMGLPISRKIFTEKMSLYHNTGPNVEIIPLFMLVLYSSFSSSDAQNKQYSY
jgi:hypothetical protein